VGILEHFLPPPGAPGAVRVAAACWRRTALDLQTLTDHVRSSAEQLSSSWTGRALPAPFSAHDLWFGTV
jgi:hypothetical protein